MWLFDVLVMNILVWNTHLDYNRRRKNPHILWNAVKATAARFDWLLGSLSDDSTVTLLSCDLCYMADSKPKAITPHPPPPPPQKRTKTKHKARPFVESDYKANRQKQLKTGDNSARLLRLGSSWV